MSAAPLPSSAGTAAAPRRSRPPLPPLAALQIKIESQHGGGGDGPASRDRAPSANGMRRARARGGGGPRRWGPGLRRHRPAEGVGRAQRTRPGGTSGAAAPAPPPGTRGGVTPAGSAASAHRGGPPAWERGGPREAKRCLGEPREWEKGTGKGWV